MIKKIAAIFSLTFAWILFILIEFLLVFFNSAIWIRIDPPASAIFTMAKLTYPNLVNKAVYAYAAVIIIIIAIFVLAFMKILAVGPVFKSMLAVLLATVIFCMAGSLLFMNVLGNAKMEFTTSAALQNAGTVQPVFDRQKRVVIDLSEKFEGKEKPTVFKLYLPDNSKKPRDVIMYLAYGNWLAIPESTADYLVDSLTEHGYAVAVFTGKTRKETDFTGIIKDIWEKVAYLRGRSTEYGIGKILLSGGSAGANLALIAAYADSLPLYSKVDGVIAFYPVVDQLYNYEYFTKKSNRGKSVLDKLGDKLFSMSDVNGAQSIDESHKKVMTALFGGLPDNEEMRKIYEMGSPAFFVKAGNPPTLLIHGSHDSMTPIEPTREMFRKLKEQGADAAILELPYTDHAFDVIMPESSIVTKKVVSSIISWMETREKI